MTIKRLGTVKAILARGGSRPQFGLPPAFEPDAMTDDAEPLQPQQLTTDDVPSSHLPLPPDPMIPKNEVGIVYLSDLQPQPADWLWQNRLAAGTLAMLSGEPGSGKTWVALAIAAALTRGKAPFTGAKLDPCTVLYVSTEHAAAQIIHPRFAQLAGDPERLVVVRGDAAAAPSAPSNLGKISTPLLENALQQTQARLLILDPWQLDLHGPAESRALLHALACLADKYRCCILLVRHLSKAISGRPIRRALPSIELTAALRTEFLAGSSPDAPTEPALLHVKSNLGPLAPPMAYKIDHTGNFSWTGLSNLTPEELLADRPTGAGTPKRKFAAQWLRQYLYEGSRTQATVELDAMRDGVCITTLRRAKFDLGIRSSKDGRTGSWWWTLPPSEEPWPAP